MNHIPVFTLDLETRLKLDALAFDDEDYYKTEIELSAFPEFRMRLETDFLLTRDHLKDSNHSLELLMLERDIKSIMSVMREEEEYLSELYSLDVSYDIDIEYHFAMYDMALRYRYALGLNDSTESFHTYYKRKTEQFRDFELYFIPEYNLPTLSFPYLTEADDRISCYVDELNDRLYELSKENERFSAIYSEICLILSKIILPTKLDWNFNSTTNREFGYLEQRAIQAEVILHLKNKLRFGIVTNFDWYIQVYTDSLYAMYHHNLLSSDINVTMNLSDLPTLNYIDANFIKTGYFGAGIYDTAHYYAEDVRMLGTRGHGIAAEKANHLIDKTLFKEAQILGDDNIKNGADRLVNGKYIQTKYCKTGGKSVGECFENGEFRYIQDGKPMQIEVPKDQYESALQSMRDRIKRGEMKNAGITDPNDAEKIIKKGHIKYITAQRIAKAGTIEGIAYDAVQGTVSAVSAFGISAAFSFAQSLWNGEDPDEAFEKAKKTGTSMLGTQVVQHIITKQIGRTAIEKSLRPATDYVVKNVLGSKTSAQIVNTFLEAPVNQTFMVLQRQITCRKFSVVT